MTTTIDRLTRDIATQEMGQTRISLDAFIESYNNGDPKLVDIRLPDEVAVWRVNFGLKIPATVLHDQLDEPPTGKLLLVSCTTTDRSNRAGR